MARARWQQIVRRFPENGLKLLLEDARNVRDLLALTRSGLLPLIDFDRLQLVRTSFVARDFRHVEADVVLTAPLRGKGGRKKVWLYILIEHQSEPDPLMPVRLLDYLVQILKAQMRAWMKEHRSFAGFRLQPVLPVVLYTGTERWDTLGRLADLMEQAEHFAPFAPDFKAFFLNLSALPAELLTSVGGHFGWVLRLIQGRRARPAEFRKLLEQVVGALEAMPDAERLRWLEFLSYLHMLVYHEREGSEHSGLREMIEASVQTDPRRKEMHAVGEKIIDVLTKESLKRGRREGRKQGRAEGAIRAKQETLLSQLRLRFGELPEAAVQAISGTRDAAQLDAWLARFAVAKALKDVGLPPG